MRSVLLKLMEVQIPIQNLVNLSLLLEVLQLNLLFLIQLQRLYLLLYVFRYHALVSVPTLFVMAAAHYFWQKFMDKKEKGKENEKLNNQVPAAVNVLIPA